MDCHEIYMEYRKKCALSNYEAGFVKKGPPLLVFGQKQNDLLLPMWWGSAIMVAPMYNFFTLNYINKYGKKDLNKQ